MSVLDGKVALVLGVANAHSIAAGCAQAFAAAGAEVALTYQNAKAKAFVAPVAEAVGAKLDQHRIDAICDHDERTALMPKNESALDVRSAESAQYGSHFRHCCPDHL